MSGAARLLPSRLLFIADSSHAADLPALVARAAAAGVGFFEVRRPRSSGDGGSGVRLAEVSACLRAAGGGAVLVNDRVDLAVLAGAAGAHVGQDDLPAVAARQILGPGRFLGLSTHDPAQAAEADALPAGVLDYVAVGPVFASRTKSGHAPVLGLEGLASCCARTRLPVVAIGGIRPEDVAGILAAGATAVAVAGALHPDVEERASAFLAALAPAGPDDRVAGPGGLVLLAGPPGAGKSAVGRLLAARMGVPFHDLDDLASGGTGAAALIVSGGEAALRAAEGDALAALVRRGGKAVVALGGGTLLTARARLLAASERLVALDVTVEVCLARLRATGERRPLLEAARAGGAAAVARHFSERAVPDASVRVDGMAGPEAVAEAVVRALADGIQPSPSA